MVNRSPGTSEISSSYTRSVEAYGPPPSITPFTRQGINRIEVTVYGTLKNLLGPHHNVTRRGIVTPWSFKYAPERQPSGDSYDLYDYGLFTDFSVLCAGDGDR